MSQWRFNLAVMIARPRLLIAGAVGLTVDAVLLFGVHLRPSTALTLGWDAFCVVFLALVAAMIAGEAPEAIAARAATQDEGQHLILFLTIGASAASLAAVAAELHLVKTAHGLTQALHVGLAVATVAGSWLVMQVILALHYAHEYYARGTAVRGRPGVPGGRTPRLLGLPALRDHHRRGLADRRHRHHRAPPPPPGHRAQSDRLRFQHPDHRADDQSGGGAVLRERRCAPDRFAK